MLPDPLIGAVLCLGLAACCGLLVYDAHQRDYGNGATVLWTVWSVFFMAVAVCVTASHFAG